MLLAACAEPADPGRMVTDQSVIVAEAKGTPFRNNIAVVKVTGGEDTNPLWTSEIGNKQFSDALEQSLRVSHLTPENLSDARFELSAHLSKTDQPLIGLDLTVTTHTTYQVTEKSSGKTWFSEKIITPFTAAFSSSFVAVKRLQIANEGAMRTNIAEFIRQLLASGQNQ